MHIAIAFGNRRRLLCLPGFHFCFLGKHPLPICLPINYFSLLSKHFSSFSLAQIPLSASWASIYLLSCLPAIHFRFSSKHPLSFSLACHSFSLLKQASSLFFSCLAIILPLRQAFPDFLACLTARFSFLGSYSCLKVTASFIKIPIRQ